MIKIQRPYGEKFIELASANTCNTVYPMAVAEQVQEGDVFADDVENPTYALFWHVSGFAYLTGRPDEEALTEIYMLMKNENGQNPRRFVLELKDEKIEDFFGKKSDVQRHPRYRFRLSDAQEEVKDSLIPAGYELKEADASLLTWITGRIVPSQFWSSPEKFLKNGKGFCLLQDGEVATVAFSAAVSSRQVDIGIETKESHRKKGLAAAVAKQMISYVKSIGKEPVWDCDQANTGSKATAEKVGFEVVAEHSYYKVESK